MSVEKVTEFMKGVSALWKSVIAILAIAGAGFGAYAWADDKIKERVESKVKQIEQRQKETADDVKQVSTKLDRLMEILIQERRK